MVAPDLQGRGIGRLLLGAIEQAAPADVHELILFTGAGSERNLRMYKKAGYRPRADPDGLPGTVQLVKRRRTA
jgi:tRNA (guanine37-N1)-methyltransferase